MVRDLEDLQLPTNIVLFTSDVESLYPSIPTSKGLHALRNLIQGHFSLGEFNLIMSLASLTLQHHYLEFNGEFSQQIYGTTNLFLCFVENAQEARIELRFFKRYLDDALCFWDGEKKDLIHFLDSYAQGVKEHIKTTSYVVQSCEYLLKAYLSS